MKTHDDVETVRKLIFRSVAECVAGAGSEDAGSLGVREKSIERDATKTDDHAQLEQQAKLFIEKRRTVAQLFRGGFVARRRATTYRCDLQIGESHAIVARPCERLRRESRFVEHRIKEIAGAVSGEGTTCAVGAVCAGSEAQSQDARVRIAKGRNRLAPILPIGIGAAAHLRNVGAVLPKPRASIAGDDAGVEGFQLGARRRHNVILLDSAMKIESRPRSNGAFKYKILKTS